MTMKFDTYFAVFIYQCVVPSHLSHHAQMHYQCAMALSLITNKSNENHRLFVFVFAENPTCVR